jgi:hypothetical protein
VRLQDVQGLLVLSGHEVHPRHNELDAAPVLVVLGRAVLVPGLLGELHGSCRIAEVEVCAAEVEQPEGRYEPVSCHVATASVDLWTGQDHQGVRVRAGHVRSICAVRELSDPAEAHGGAQVAPRYVLQPLVESRVEVAAKVGQ